MSIKIEVTPQLQNILNRLEMLGRGIMPQTAQAIDISAGFVQRTWVSIAQGQDLSGKPEDVHFSGSIDYANSIRILSMGAFTKVVYSDSDIGGRLQSGTPEYDMKPALVNGPKSRVAEDGHRYNIIPFSHSVKELKNVKIGGQSAYALAKQLTKQRVIGFRIDEEGKKRFTYEKWTKDKKLDVTNRFLAGLVRMDTSTGRAQSSQYLTFRTVNLSQVGRWIRKAQSAWDIVRQVADKTKVKIQEFVTDAIKMDVLGD